MKREKLELLAPVGGTEHLRAAVQAGADAVYLGGKLFNARIKAENFNDEEMQYAVDYAHQRGVRVYVTMNTLLRDEDLQPALSYAAELYMMGVDALIIQDLGFAALVRKYIPGFEVHLSTQGTVYNREGVKIAGELGFSRVVLARELTLAEIAECCEVGPEIEVFVHGALCVCYSGQCNMSKFNGGRSGNQGMCAQPCRLSYTDEKNETGHFLSPKDNCALDQLGALIDAGVTSFKIEGRMKSPEYVAIVTGIYRKYIDMYVNNGMYNVSEEDRRALLQAFNRGGFTDGYMKGRTGRRMMALDVPKHQGILIGHTVRKAYQNLVEIELNPGSALNMGDGVEIHNRELSGNVVTFLKPAKDQAGTEGRRLIIGDINGYIKGGEAVYKITDRELNEQAEALYKVGKDGNDAGTRKLAVKLDVSLHVGKPAVISAKLLGTKQDVIASLSFEDIIPEIPLRQAMQPARIREQLSKCGDYPYEIEELNLESDDNLALAVSALNRMRREILNELSLKHKERSKGERKSLLIPKTLDLTEDYTSSDTSIVHTYEVGSETKYGPHNALLLGESNSENKMLLLPAEAVINRFAGFDGGLDYAMLNEYMDDLLKVNHMDSCALYLSGVSKGKTDEWIRSNIGLIKAAAEETGNPVYVGNPGQIEMLNGTEIPFAADYRMNICNSASADVMKELGAVSIVEALEYRDDVRGMIPMMITEQPLNLTTIQSRIREKNGLKPMRVLKSYFGDKTLILGKVE